MANLDSRTATMRETISIYVSSAPMADNWGQPPASYHVLRVEGVTLHGHLINPPVNVYQSSPGSSHSVNETIMSYALSQELESWQAAANEALADFEASLLNIVDNNENNDRQI